VGPPRKTHWFRGKSRKKGGSGAPVKTAEGQGQPSTGRRGLEVKPHGSRGERRKGSRGGEGPGCEKSGAARNCPRVHPSREGRSATVGSRIRDLRGRRGGLLCQGSHGSSLVPPLGWRGAACGRVAKDQAGPGMEPSGRRNFPRPRQGGPDPPRRRRFLPTATRVQPERLIEFFYNLRGNRGWEGGNGRGANPQKKPRRRCVRGEA